MDDKTVKTLEYEAILSKIQNFAVSLCAKKAISELTPFDNEQKIKTALAETESAYKIKYAMGLDPIEEFDDCRDIIEKSVKGVILTPAELIKIRRLLRSGRIAQSVLSPIEASELKVYSENYYLDRNLEDEIEKCIVSENELSDNASSTLRDIRRKIAEKKNSLKEKLSSYFRKSEYSKFMQDNLVTIRNDRFVLPVKSEYRSSVPGLIHDISSSGATVFIEPFAVVETNNEIKSLKLSEVAEIERILSDFTQRTAKNSENLYKMQTSVLALDIIFAKAKFSADINGSMPILNKKGKIDLKNARHPIIDKAKVVPISILIDERKILIITGPNTGGKTVSLKTVGLVCLMAYSGLYIPCDEGSEIALFDNIFCDIGDEQSITESLSTFSSHLTNIIRITNELSKNTLVLLDELGGGTDPQEGAAIAIGIIKYIEFKGATAVITTHYTELKEYALSSKNIISAGMQFDLTTFRPTYKLIIGVPGTSNALKIAKILGLNDTIISFAIESMSNEKIRLENLLSSAEAMKSKAEEELNKTEEIKLDLIKQREALTNKQKELEAKLEKINFSAKAEIKRLVSAGVEKADEMIEELKEKVKNSDEKALFEAKSIKKRLENMVYEFDEPESIAYEEIDFAKLKVGDKVFIKSLNSVGTLEDIQLKKNKALVSLGSIKTEIKLKELAKPIEIVKETKRTTKNKFIPSKPSGYDVIPEINVIGYTVSEAIEIVEPHLVSLFNGDGTKTLRVVHGKGTGALGKGLQQYFKTSPLIKTFRYGRYGEGENGVTVVELKNKE